MADNEDAKRRNKLTEDIDRVSDWLTVAKQNGLFKQQKITKTSDSIHQTLLKARFNLNPDDVDYSIERAEYNIRNAVDDYYTTINDAGLWWRLKNLYALFVWFYLAVLLVIVFVLYYGIHIDKILLNALGISEQGQMHYYSNGIYAATWGLIGGILRGFWFLKEHVDDHTYRNSWIIWFLSCPFLGAILGVVVYFTLVAGLITLTISDIDIKNPWVMIPIGSVAGFSWPSSIEQIKKVANVLSGTKT